MGVADSTGEKVIDTYTFLIDSVILRNKSRLPDALQLVDQALETYPKYARLYAMKGIILNKLNRTKRAVDYLEAAFKSRFRSVDMFHHLGLAYERLGERSKAEEMFKRALELDVQHAESLYHLGKLAHQNAAASGQKRARLHEAER